MRLRCVSCLLTLTLVIWCSAQLQGAERWVYAQTNLQLDAQADQISDLIKRAKLAGFTHLLLTDSKFARVPTLPDRYFRNVEKVKAVSKTEGIEVVPALFGVGYSNDLLSNDPNLAEGLPVKDALFVVKDDIAAHVPDPDFQLAKKWSFIDDNLTATNGVFSGPTTEKNARFSQPLTLHPWRQYHVSVEVRTQDFASNRPEIKIIASGQQLNFTYIHVKETQEWTTHHVTFNSLQHEKAQIYFGTWGGHKGTIEWRNPQLEETGLVNVLRRPGTPFVVRSEDGRTLKEGIDFHPFTDPKLGSVPYGGEYEPWHEPVSLHTKAMPEGTRLRISYFHPHIIYEGQVCACVSEPAFNALLKRQAADVNRLWSPRSFMMQHDEWRVLNHCAACQARKLTPGQIVADNVSFCQNLLTQVSPGCRILVWSDMFDPHHNAKRSGYYLVNGALTDSWLGLSKDTILVNWNSGEADKSLRHFAERGHKQLIAGYYDGPLSRTQAWLRGAKEVPGVIGVMYTTWKRDYTQLEAFAEMLKAEGF